MTTAIFKEPFPFSFLPVVAVLTFGRMDFFFFSIRGVLPCYFFSQASRLMLFRVMISGFLLQQPAPISRRQDPLAVGLTCVLPHFFLLVFNVPLIPAVLFAVDDRSDCLPTSSNLMSCLVTNPLPFVSPSSHVLARLNSLRYFSPLRSFFLLLSLRHARSPLISRGFFSLRSVLSFFYLLRPSNWADKFCSHLMVFFSLRVGVVARRSTGISAAFLSSESYPS